MKPIYLSLVSLMSMGTAFSAATVLYDFESSDYSVISGETRVSLPSPTWIQSVANPSIDNTEYQVSYAEGWSNVTGGAGTKSGAIGTAIINSTAATTTVSASLGSSPILNQKITTTIALTDSTAGFSTRDSFGMSISNSLGVSIGSITFTPVSTDTSGASGWTVSYTTGTGVGTAPGTIVAGAEYNFSLTFHAGSVELYYSPADGSSSNTIYFNPAGYDSSSTIGNIGFSVTQSGSSETWGDSSNFMRFDNITSDVVPEASTFALAGVAALGLLRRRRN